MSSIPTRFLFPSALLLPLLAGCKSIPRAPAGQPRVELEVDVAVEAPFQQALVNADAGLQQAVESTILGDADAGLRFYPILSRDYAEGQARPQYRMVVRVRDLDLDVTPATGGKEARLDRITAAVAASLEKRRQGGPPLLVAQSTGSATGSTRATGAAEASYSITGAGAAPTVTRAAILDAVRKGFDDRLRDMLPAIDRELGQTGAR